MTHDDGSRDDDPARPRRRDGPKERVLHTRVPAVLEQELKQLAKNLRVPVSNVVRAILEDAVDAVDTVGEVAQGELLGFVDRVSRQRASLRRKVAGDEEAPGEAPSPDDAPAEEGSADAPASPDAEPAPACPAAAPDLLDGVFGYQPLVLASDTACSVCGASLPAGSDACRALFDEPGRRVFLGPECRLMPEKRG